MKGSNRRVKSYLLLSRIKIVFNLKLVGKLLIILLLAFNVAYWDYHSKNITENELSETIEILNEPFTTIPSSNPFIPSYPRFNTGFDTYMQDNGTVICNVAGSQTVPEIILDGDDGAIIVWVDERADEGDIYAQHITLHGVISWDSSGVVICNAGDLQKRIRLASDGTGGAIITWLDNRTGTYDIRAQRVDSAGQVQWLANGITVCNYTGAVSDIYSYPEMCSDGAGGAIIAWRDFRELGTTSGGGYIYAQRINANGQAEWTANGTRICQYLDGTDGGKVSLCTDGDGGAIITWGEQSSVRPTNTRDIYAQHVNATGDDQWSTDGVPVCTQSFYQYQPRICSDGAGGAIITWHDYRSGNWENADIYAQLLNSAGQRQWTPLDGIAICTATDQSDKAAWPISDGAGGAIIEWVDEPNAKFYTQRVDSAGIVKWDTNGIELSTAGGTQQGISLCSDGTGGAIYAWSDDRTGNFDVYMQHINSTGDRKLSDAGKAICTENYRQGSVRVCSVGAGGVFTAWEDDRTGTGDYDIYGQYVAPEINLPATYWQDDGAVICNATDKQQSLRMIYDGTNGAILAWSDNRTGTWDVYAQHITLYGDISWESSDVVICNADGIEKRVQLASDGAGGAIITWLDNRTGNYDIRAQKVDSAGQVQWTANGVTICNYTGAISDSYSFPKMCNDGAGGAIITWRDFRELGTTSGGGYTYAQRVNTSGHAEWATNGTRICQYLDGEAGNRIALCSDGNGGAIFTWGETSVRSNNKDIYAQHVNATGHDQWPVDGVPVCEQSHYQYAPEICSDGAGGAIIAWHDYRSGNWGNADIYAQRLNSAGQRQWTPLDGITICNATDQSDKYPRLISDGSGGAIIEWFDEPNVKFYTQRVDSAGSVKWVANGTGLSTAGGNQKGYLEGIYIGFCSDGTGGAIYAWSDDRTGNLDVYVQHINSTGDRQLSDAGKVICDVSGIQSGVELCSDELGGVFIAWEDDRPGTSDYDIYGQFVEVIDLDPLIDSPEDITYGLGATGNKITWTSAERHPDNYTLYIDESINLIDDTWDGSPITIPVDGLSTGVYNYTVVVGDQLGKSTSDTVFVTVGAVPIFSNPPTDFEIYYGDTGYSISWSVSDAFPDNYTVYRNDTVFDEGDWTTSITVWLGKLAIGIHNFTCLAENGDGFTASDEVWVTVHPPIPDTEPPVISQPDNIIFEQGSIGYTITWTGSDARKPWWATVKRGQTVVYNQPWDGEDIVIPLDGLPIGTYLFNCTLFDEAGNSASSVVEVTVTPPVPDDKQPDFIKIPDPVEYEEGTTGHYLTWNCTDDHPYAYKIFINGIEVLYSPWHGENITFSIDGLGIGEWEVNLTIWDLSRNKNSNKVLVRVIPPVPDTTPPTISQPAELIVAENQSGRIVWEVSDEHPSSYVIMRNDSIVVQEGYWMIGIIQYSFVSLPLGTWEFNLTIWDEAGNFVSSIATVKVLMGSDFDTDPPQISHFADREITYGSINNILHINIFDQHPDKYCIYLNSTEVVSTTWTIPNTQVNISLDGLSIGYYVINITTWDIYGNKASRTGIVTVTGDDTAPLINSPPDLVTSEGMNTTVTWQVSDEAPDKYEILSLPDGNVVESGKWSGNTIVFDVSTLTVGTYHFQCIVYDASGNYAMDSVVITVLEREGVPSPGFEFHLFLPVLLLLPILRKGFNERRRYGK